MRALISDRCGFLLALLVKDAIFVDVFFGNTLRKALEKIIPIALDRPGNERPALSMILR